ncbi:kinase-like domain-containing protein [Infundibulicybe gibba]|nr:kinase-like domain-containing protein [Infundibulicybe gibba]
MTPPAAKREASTSPDGERAPKRIATSSPEEGELDDGLGSQSPPSAVASAAPKLPVPKPRVPFPFKKKTDLPRTDSVDPQESQGAVAAVYERPAEDERRFRDSDMRRKQSWHGGKADHWEPGYNNHRNDSGPSSRYHRRDHRDRDRRSPLPYSPSRSHSPSSPSSHRPTHRLPPRKIIEATFSPPHRDYQLDRIRDWERDRERRYRDPDADRYYHSDRSRDTGERYYRPDHGDTRDWTRRDEPYDSDRRGHRPGERGYERNRYTPRSPRAPSPLPIRPTSPPPPPSDPTDHHAPPPPALSPPPPPPPDTRLLKPDHAPVSIATKRPGAPKDIHSPPSMALPVQKAPEQRLLEKPMEQKEVPPQPTKRTRKQEMELYGRTFEGCGVQADYEVTTKLGEGTFGEVHKAIQKATGKVVALKRILMHNEKEGMPVTALREIKILKALKHSCIVDILDMFVVRSTEQDPLSVYMVFPYMDHDLAGLLENERVKLQPSHIKLYMKQLLEGTEYMHRNHILHRDMKAANLLISNSGSLRIADFGLARSYDVNVTRGVSDHRGRERKYTNCVVTRWYRPPELLLGARQYGGEVDLWGIGCVLGEMFSRRPILPGTSDLDQLEKIWQLCGTPNQHTWPNYDALPGCEGVKRFSTNHSRRIKQTYESVGPETCDLLDKLLTCNPRERITASQALDHDYFWTDPLPADPKTLPSYEASHEFDRRGHRNQHPPPGPPPGPPLPHDPHHRHPPLTAHQWDSRPKPAHLPPRPPMPQGRDHDGRGGYGGRREPPGGANGGAPSGGGSELNYG